VKKSLRVTVSRFLIGQLQPVQSSHRLILMLDHPCLSYRRKVKEEGMNFFEEFV